MLKYLMPGVAHPEPDAVLAQSGEILVRANYRPVFGTFNTLIGLSEGMGDGADWHDLAAAVSVNDTASRVTIEFGADRTLNEVRLQADLNDTYLVTFSTNGKDFSDPWVLGPIQEGAGLQTHQTPEGFSRTARFVRIAAVTGDGAYSFGRLDVVTEAGRPARAPG